MYKYVCCVVWGLMLGSASWRLASHKEDAPESISMHVQLDRSHNV